MRALRIAVETVLVAIVAAMAWNKFMWRISYVDAIAIAAIVGAVVAWLADIAAAIWKPTTIVMNVDVYPSGTSVTSKEEYR